jgi:TRAP-type uncharacterized transport system substrate-binding protein
MNTIESPGARKAFPYRWPRVNRRGLLRLAAASGLWLILTGHSPYRQWDVYRKVRLVVVVNAEDAESVQLGQAIAELLAKHLPGSRAMMARARDINVVVRLLASKQLDTALVREDDASAAFGGSGRFADNGKVPLRTLAQFGPYLFVSRDDLLKPNAYQIAEAIAEHWRAFDAKLVAGTPGPRPLPSVRVPIHSGALEYYEDDTHAKQ